MVQTSRSNDRERACGSKNRKVSNLHFSNLYSCLKASIFSPKYSRFYGSMNWTGKVYSHVPTGCYQITYVTQLYSATASSLQYGNGSTLHGACTSSVMFQWCGRFRHGNNRRRDNARCDIYARPFGEPNAPSQVASVVEIVVPLVRYVVHSGSRWCLGYCTKATPNNACACTKATPATKLWSGQLSTRKGCALLPVRECPVPGTHQNVRYEQHHESKQ
jgi:hypothetical protein